MAERSTTEQRSEGESRLGDGPLDADSLDSTDTDIGVDTPTRADSETRSGDGGSMLRGLRSATVAVQLIVAVVGFLVGGAVPLVPFSGFAGLAVAMVLTALISETGTYGGAAMAGAAVGGVSTLIGSLGLTVVSGGIAPLVGAGAGAVIAIGGHYAGRDLRAGLTREI
jgi:hypothetical protein